MTAQEVFDTVATHLLRQGKKALDRNGVCQYRGPGGLACAVGCLISDEDYSPSLEGESINTLLSHGKLPWLLPHRNLLTSLQELHDNAEVETWAEELDYLASCQGLVFTPVRSADETAKDL